MIRKPPEDWYREDHRAVDAIRAAGAVAKDGARAMRRGGHLVVGLVCYFFAAMWGFAALASGLAMGGLPSLVGIGAMAAGMFWLGRRAFRKVRA